MDTKHTPKFIVFLALYVILNVLVTYMVTTELLNPYIVTFSRTPITWTSSVLGDVACLSILCILGMIFIKKERGVCRYLLVVTFALNVFIFVLGVFTKNYKTMMSFYNMTLFRNPSAGFAGGVIIDAAKELFLRLRIVDFIPYVVLQIYYLICNKSFKHQIYPLRLIPKLIIIDLALFASLFSVLVFEVQLKGNWKYRTDTPLYGCQTCGLYNYYFAELVYGVNYSEEYSNQDVSIEEILDKLQDYNKNKASYVNLVDGLTYTRPASGIFAGKNLFIIQMEALQTVALDYMYYNDELTPCYLMPNMQSLLKEKTSTGKQTTFYFNNAYTVVGLGNTSDAEFSVNSGLYPLGDDTISWEAYDYDIQVQNLCQALGNNYTCYSYNPTYEIFYGHKFTHENFYHFDEFTGIDTYSSLYPTDEYSDRYLNGNNWVADYYMLNYSKERAETILANGKNFYTFVETISPHYPYMDMSTMYPEGTVYEVLEYPAKEIGNKTYELSEEFQHYLNQFHFNDSIFYNFIQACKDSLPNTVFVFYGDHGNSLSKEDYEYLAGKELTDFEYRQKLLNVPIIFYDPSGDLADYCASKSLDVEAMTSRVVNQIDLHTTLELLFNVGSQEYSWGTNLFSKEPSYSIDPKNLDIITDDFIVSLKKYEDQEQVWYQKFDGSTITNEDKEIVKRISELKLYNDYYLTYLIKNANERTDHGIHVKDPEEAKR